MQRSFHHRCASWHSSWTLHFNDFVVRDQSRPMTKLRGAMWNYSDVMPSSLCDCLDMPRGSSYAQGARSARRWIETRKAA